MKSFTKTSLFILSALFISSMSIGFASEPAKPVDEVKKIVENQAADPAEIAEDSEATELPEGISCGECGKKGDHYADCGCGKKKKNKLELA